MGQLFRLGVQHLLKKEYDRAAAAFGEVVRESPQDGAAWSNYGLALTHLGKAAEAELALSRAIALVPKNGEAWFHLGVARALREEWGDAASAYRRAVALEPNDLVAWHRLGVALAECGEEPAASVALERALVLSRELPTASGASARTSAGRTDDHSQEGGEREGSREAKSWLDLALSLLALGDEDEAIAAYERAYTLDPDRATHSLFRPMLRLLTAVGEETPAALPDSLPPPDGPERPEAVRPPRRPEVG
jgi:tetratricopeptide (TPR) repeat protein